MIRSVLHSPSGCCLSRRSLIGGAAAAVLSLAAGMPQASPSRRKASVVDTHHHYYPPEYVARRRDDILAVSPGYGDVVNWTPQRSIAAMDEAGVDKAILSISTPGVWLDDPETSRAIARECNEYAASLAKAHPDRFGFFASIPLPDETGSLAEIDYAFDKLGADGAVLLTNYNGRYLGDKAFARALAELDGRKAVVFVHPTAGDCCRHLVPELPPAFIEFPTDTTRTAASLLFSGTLARLRSLRFIFSHGGGTLPMLTGRMGMWLTKNAGLRQLYPDGLEAEFARYHYDVVSISSPSAVSALVKLAPISNLLFGSDFPYGPIRPLLDQLTAFGLSETERALLLGGNAIRLLNL